MFEENEVNGDKQMKTSYQFTLTYDQRDVEK